MTPMPLLQSGADDDDRLAGGARRAMAAAMPKLPKSTDLVTTAFLPSVGLSKVMISILRPAGAKRS